MRYLLKNDFRFLFKSLIIFIIILIVEILFGSLIVSDNVIDILLGRNYNGVLDLLSILFYLLNLLYFIYVSLQLLIRDLTYNLDNVFFRISPLVFIFEKILFIIVVIFVLRFIQYILLVLVFFGESVTLSSILFKVLKDTFYYSALSCLSVFFRQCYYKINYFYMLCIVGGVIIIPKSMDKSYLLYLIILVFFVICNMLIMNYKCKYIIEKEGEVK